MAEKGYDFPVLIEEGLKIRLGRTGYPTTYFIDREGRVSFAVLGARAPLVEEFTWRVKALLESSREFADGGEP